MDYKYINKYFTFLSYTLSVMITILVFATGGTNKVYANLMYIPIAIVSSTNGKKVGILHSIISALLVGPFMPLHTDLNIPQEPINWITRLIIYVTIAFIIGFFSDYNRKNKEYITNLLTHDFVSNYKNVEALKHEGLTSKNERTIIVLSVADYDNILNFFGYQFVLNTVSKFAKELKEALSHYSNIEFYRYYGLQFILSVTHNTEDTDIEMILNDLKKFNKYTLYVDDIPIYIELFIGIAKVKKDMPIFEGIRQAFIALEHSKIEDKKLSIYENSLEKDYYDKVNIVSNFTPALQNGNIKVAYQNIYNCQGQTYGMELLARWITDSGSQIFPSSFIPVIEKTELINDLTKYIIDVAIKSIISNEGTVVSINFSPNSFKEDVVNYLLDKMKGEGINPAFLQVEVTEDVLVKKEEGICYLGLISNEGIRIAIDDFGSGYSSLQYLSEFPFDVVKIDKALIQKLDEDKLTLDLVKSIVGICKNNNIVTIAEGVENKGIADMCLDLGIDLLQGYYYHRPSILTK